MAMPLYGGRVLAGEDSEEDDDEEDCGFEFGGLQSTSMSGVAQQQVDDDDDEDEEKEEEEEEDEEGEDDDVEDEDNRAIGEKDHEGANRSDASTPRRAATPPLPSTTPSAVTEQPGDASALPWRLNGSENGMDIMTEAIFSRMQISLDSSLRRIAELNESQQRLLQDLQSENEQLLQTEQVDRIDGVMSQIPDYIRKVQQIRQTMNEVTTSLDKMRRKSENLRVDAQSHAMKKATRNEVLSQWNKLYAARSTTIVPTSPAEDSSSSSS